MPTIPIIILDAIFLCESIHCNNFFSALTISKSDMFKADILQVNDVILNKY